MAHRTKRYFIQSVIRHLIDKYILTFDTLADHMFKIFGVCIVLEDNLEFNDLIDGVFQIYEKTERLKNQESDKSYA